MEGMVFRGVDFSYEDHGKSFAALMDIDLEIRKGEFLCILGRSGCGKTTLLRLMAGLSLPQKGEVLLDGVPVTQPGTDRAVVFQQGSLFPWMTVRKNVEFSIRQARRALSRKEVRALSDNLLAKVGMEDAAEKYPYQLSGGMRQRAALCRALAMDGEYLLLDEPFGALDARNRGELQELLLRLRQNEDGRKTVVFVTHDIREAALLADRIVYMEPGRIASVIPVGISRPRDLKSEACRRLCRQLLELFYEEEMGETQR